MMKSLWDGHEYRSTVTRADSLSALRCAAVVVDTNVLLDLYRYVSGPREQLLTALEDMKDQIFIPHQVAVEFWRGREGAVNDASIGRPPVIDQLSDAGESARQSINEWANRVGIGLDERSKILKVVDDAISKASSIIETTAELERATRASNTSADLILDRIVELCRDRVGDAPEAATLAERTKEGLRRANEGEPPGYRDKKKNAARVVGDYLLWCEAMDVACSRGVDLVFVTRDTKDDWWTIVSGEPIGPRVELVEEFWRMSSGKRTYFLRPSQFVAMVAEMRGRSAPDAVAQLEFAERAGLYGDWSVPAARDLLAALNESNLAQFEAVKHAALNEGRVPRETVYRIAGYEPGRTLRGFGRPVNRLARAIYDPRGEMEDFPPVFDAYYDPDISWVQAAGFRLVDGLISPLREVLASDRSGQLDHDESDA